MPEWTKAQLDAINADGGTLLVTAAAGSGKTSVLTERIIRIVTEEKRDIDRLLVVTFTRAAASEMKERISAKLSQLCALNPSDPHLARQKMLLNRANISTVHSFCTSFIRENFKAAEVECDFRLLDDSEYELMKADVLDKVLEERYAGNDEGFSQLADMLSSDRNDAGLRACILKMFEFLSSDDDRDGWLDRIEKSYEGDSKENIWIDMAARNVEKELHNCLLLAKAALSDAETDELLEKAYAPSIRDDINHYSLAYEAAKNNNLNEAAREADFPFMALGRVMKFHDEELKNRVKNRRDEAKKRMTALRSGLLCYTEEKIKQDTARIRPSVIALISILRDYITNLDEAKRNANALSFDDLEQKTISLLTCTDGKGNRIKTPLAIETSSRFDEILVDEYQDTNPAQALIFSALSKNEENLFMVGDIKQAIYAFRNASPEDFGRKKEAYSSYKKEAPVFPASIALSANFRSREGITDFVNFLFELVCTKELGGTEYDESEHLYSEGEFPKKDENIADTELYFVNTSLSDDTLEKEAEFITRRIKALMKENIKVKIKNGGERPLTYSDIAIVSRTVKKLYGPLSMEFEKAGIPMDAPGDDSFLSLYEVNVALSLLRVLDNPYQDVPLACIMASPVFGFTSDELALMRVESRSVPFYDAVRMYAKAREDSKTESFLKTVEDLRKAAAILPADKLLLSVYSATFMPQLLSAGNKGKRVKRNLDRLVSMATDFSSTAKNRLPAFLRYIDRLEESGCRLISAAAESGDGVKLMTIHGSKGLEFPVVILAGNTKFNRSDSTDRYLVHRKLGFGGRIREGNIYYSTVQRDIISDRIKAEQTSEELRVLYVALTRASLRLIVCASVTSLEKKIGTYSGINGHPELLKVYLQEAASFNDWLLPVACMHPCGKELCYFGGISPQTVTDSERQKIFTGAGEYNEIKLPEYTFTEEITEAQTEEEAEITEEFDSSVFDWQYPYAENLTLPTKVSASGVSHSQFISKAALIRPSFVSRKDDRLVGAEAGTAVHLFMSKFDFASDKTVREQLSDAIEKGILTKEQAEVVNVSACEVLLHSPLGKRISAAAKRNGILQEYGFAFRVDAEEIPTLRDCKGKILVSGTADLIFFENGIPVIIDFKTDRVKAMEELSERYSTQLKLYSQAARALWNTQNAEAHIWSFTLEDSLEIPV